MLHNRFLILLGGCLLASSAAWADEVGYVDCTNHPEEIQVFAKARRTPDLVASLPCGERFTVLVYGFVFSRIQTRDGKVGYLYSNLIAVDRAATAAQQAGSAQLASAKVKIPSVSAVTPPNQPAPAQSQPTAVQTAPAAAPASAAPETAAIVVQPAPPAPVEPVPTPAQPSPAVAPASPPDPAPNAPETSASIVQPTRNTSSQPEASRVEPAAPAIRPADTRTIWEKPRPGGVRRAPLLELFCGYAFARLDGGGGTGTNVNGAMGSFGWNIKPWLQIVADTSYNTVT